MLGLCLQAMTHLEVARLLLSSASTLQSHMSQQAAAGVSPASALRCAAISKRILDTLQTPIAKDEQVGRLSLSLTGSHHTHGHCGWAVRGGWTCSSCPGVSRWGARRCSMHHTASLNQTLIQRGRSGKRGLTH